MRLMVAPRHLFFSPAKAATCLSLSKFKPKDTALATVRAAGQDNALPFQYYA